MKTPRHFAYGITKRVIDLLVAIPALVFALPVLLWALASHLKNRKLLKQVSLVGRNQTHFTSFTC